MDALASSTAAVLLIATVKAELAKYGDKFFGTYPGTGAHYVVCAATRQASSTFNLDRIRVTITQTGTLGDVSTPMKFTITRNGVLSGEIPSTKPANPRGTFEFSVGEAIISFQNVDEVDYDHNLDAATPLTYTAWNWIEFAPAWSLFNSVQHDPRTGKPNFDLPHIPPRYTSSGFVARTFDIATDWIDCSYSPFELNDPLGQFAPTPPEFATDTLASAAVGDEVMIDSGQPIVGFWQTGIVVADGDFNLPFPLTTAIPAATRATSPPVGYVSPIPHAFQGQPGHEDMTVYSVVSQTSDGKLWFSPTPPTSPPWKTVIITVGTAGALGTMTFVWSANGHSGASGSTTANHSGAFLFQIPATGLKLLFAAGSYVAGSTYSVTTDPLVSRSPTAIDTVTIFSFALGSESAFYCASLTTVGSLTPPHMSMDMVPVLVPGDVALVEVSPGAWRYCTQQ
jgi:hypothetical protein